MGNSPVPTPPSTSTSTRTITGTIEVTVGDKTFPLQGILTSGGANAGFIGGFGQPKTSPTDPTDVDPVPFSEAPGLSLAAGVTALAAEIGKLAGSPIDISGEFTNLSSIPGLGQIATVIANAEFRITLLTINTTVSPTQFKFGFAVDLTRQPVKLGNIIEIDSVGITIQHPS